MSRAGNLCASQVLMNLIPQSTTGSRFHESLDDKDEWVKRLWSIGDFSVVEESWIM